MILILPGHMTEVAHDLTYLKAGMILFKSCIHKHRYVKYVSSSLMKSAGTDPDMWYMQQLSSCRRRKYFIAKLDSSVATVRLIHQIFSEANTEHSFQYCCSYKKLFWKELGRISYFYTLKCITFNFITYTNFNTNLQNMLYSLNGDSYYYIFSGCNPMLSYRQTPFQRNLCFHLHEHGYSRFL